jgi:SSS family solute:Na+ symporter
MSVFGLHIVDVAIIALYIAVILWLGRRAGRKTRDTGDFYLAGRSLGKFYQFFLNFGCSTNADQAVAVSREIYRQGIGGMWIQYLVLFLTPFYWFTTLFFRRSRLTTIGDFFSLRFKSKFLGGSYAVFILLVSIIGGGVGYMVAAKTLMALTPRTIDQCSPAERQSILEFREYRELKTRVDQYRDLTPRQAARCRELREKDRRGELHAFVSHIDAKVFYFIYGLIVALYTTMGGFRAAAVTDAIQGFLIVLFSILLIPIGLLKIGGFSGLHASVPDYMFELFGSVTLSDYAWYTILAMVLANLVSIIAVASGMQTAGSARDEMTARFGMIGGMFFKRFIMIFWALAGLLAVGLYAGKLHDPDLIWGYMTRDLLFPGAIGLMLVGILAANMSSLDAGAVSYSALFNRNLYEPLKPNRPERHYLLVGRIVVVVTLLGGILVALYIDNLLELFKYIISIPAIFGAPIWLGFIWRRLSKWAVILQVAICIVIYALIPNLFQGLDWAKTNDAFLVQTRGRVVTIRVKALNRDVAAGRAGQVGQVIEKRRTIEPVGIFFDRVARLDPTDPHSPRQGLGRFHAELWILSQLGLDLRGCTRAQLVALRFGFDALFPFLLLFLFSAVTRPVPKKDLDDFFARLHTPVQPTPQQEEAALHHAYQHPEQFERDKIFPHSNWEIMKPSRQDVLGFGGSWLLVGLILLLLWLMITIQ